MLSNDGICYVLATALFVVAAFNKTTPVRFDCLAFAALTLSLLI